VLGQHREPREVGGVKCALSVSKLSGVSIMLWSKVVVLTESIRSSCTKPTAKYMRRESRGEMGKT